ncbi:MAG: helix-turn-helix transcriptional regulator [Thermotaleaceae bacterium]
MSRVGDRIKEERIKKGITPKQLGKKCGVTESFIFEVESGKKIINEALIDRIGKALGVNLQESILLEPDKEEVVVAQKERKVEVIQPKREMVEPLAQWDYALSNIIKKIPIYDINMKKIKGHRSFPIIDRKVEGMNPEKLIYIEVPDQSMGGFHMGKGDRVLIFLNQQWTENSFFLLEAEGNKMIRKLKRAEGGKLQLISNQYEPKPLIKDAKEVKIIGKCLRIEIELEKTI